MKRVVIAEKPSVGREIAKNLGAFERNQGYIEGPDWVVTWALGHLVEPVFRRSTMKVPE